MAEKNFHRSLDHRSFYFKKMDRKTTTASRFEKEPMFRYKILSGEEIKENELKEDFTQEPEKYFTYLNTFDGKKIN